MRGYSSKVGSPRSRTYLAQMRSDYLVNTGRWGDEAASFAVDTSGLGSTTISNHLFAAGLAALDRGDQGGVEAILTRLAARGSGRGGGAGDYPPDLQATRVAELELQALVRLEKGRAEQALALIDEATVIESGMPFEFGPPFIVKPSQELKGEVLLALGRPAEARAAFEVALSRTPRRTAALLGLARAAERAGDRETAREAYATLREIWDDADTTLAELREVAGR
jgi:tetratricopeptide (TPR) repeat protein